MKKTIETVAPANGTSADSRPEIRRVKTGNRVQYFKGEEKLDFPSVTEIIGACVNKPALVFWAKNEALKRAREVLGQLIGSSNVITANMVDNLIEECKQRPEILRKAAADIGTRVHEAIDKLLNGEIPEITDDIRPAVTAAKMWIADTDMKVICREYSMLSKKLGVTGTLDLVGEDKDGLFVADYKTTASKKTVSIDDDHAGTYPENAYQLGAYANLYEETTGNKINRGFIFWLNKNEPEFLVREVKNFKRYISGFPKMVDVFNGLESVEFSRTLDYKSDL